MARKKSARPAPRKSARKSSSPRRPAQKAARKTRPAPRGRGALVGSLGMVTLHVKDIKRSIAFYRDALGLRVGDVIDTPEFGWAEFEVAPRLRLGLHADTGAMEEGARPPGGASGFYFVVPDVDAAVEKLRAKGVKVVDEPADKPYGRDAYVEDPDGNVLAIMTPS